MMQTRLAFLVGAASVWLAAPAMAQTATGVPNAVQGFATNRNLPIQIEAASLEVRDKDRVATFSDNVRLVQGDTIMECKRLVVYYEDSASSAASTGARAPNAGKTKGSQGIRKLEAHGGVVVTQKDQTATGERGDFDMKSNLVTLHGNVVITQGQNVLKGERLHVNLASGVSRIESASAQGGRVHGLFMPNAAKGPATTGSVAGPPLVVNSTAAAQRAPAAAAGNKPSPAAKPPQKLN